MKRAWVIVGICLVATLGQARIDHEKKTSGREKRKGDVVTAREDARPPTPKPLKPAEIAVSGYGFWGNRELRKLLELLQPGEQMPPTLGSDFIEDAAVILLSKLERDGYLAPRLEVHLILKDGRKLKHEWSGGTQSVSAPDDTDKLLPRRLSIKRAHFIIRRGVLYYYRHLEIIGLAGDASSSPPSGANSSAPSQLIDDKKARSFFMEAGSLIPLKRMRIYTPSRLKRSTVNLAEALTRLGYQNPSVEVTDLQQDDRTGGVNVQVTVDERLKTIVRTLQVEVYGPQEGEPEQLRIEEPNVADSRFWQQDLVQKLQTEQYRRGFPDARAELTDLHTETNEVVWVDRLARVHTGPFVTLHEVMFQGIENTRLSLLWSKLRLQEGKELNRIEVERGRHRLSRLGIFDSVGVRYEAITPEVRNVIYELDEGKRFDVSLLLGYGSYELLRGGIMVEQNNIFGMAHSARLRAIQSFKATSIDYVYTMPELIGEDINVFFDASLLRRQELTFDREEYGASAGLQRHLHAIDTEASIRYNYEFLTALDTSALTETQSVTEARVASIVLDLRHDQRDNPLLPREGYSIFSRIEVASAVLGGEVDFQRIEFGASFHLKLTDTLITHLGISHGVGLTFSSSREDLPFNKRFFPGGENSVRGYQQGEAAPRDAEGEIVGAETFLQGNFELEQILTPSWSVVGFVDGAGFAESVSDYPFDENVYSVGGGIRWKTVVGPVRLEYGYNPHPRPKDPDWTLHFSVGFPF